MISHLFKKDEMLAFAAAKKVRLHQGSKLFFNLLFKLTPSETSVLLSISPSVTLTGQYKNKH